ncbi:MAG: orotidine-5'-phosphate decarboxylase [Thermonemataceae bacterium]|nr:orotidine-5'-phosphate decarboxylase [Thermonemataceae bacterium]
MSYEDIYQLILLKKSYLCVGLDTDISKIPKHLLSEKDPIFEFNKQIIDATLDFAIAYKPNIAFYEAQGTKGWESLQKTIAYLPKDVFKIADAKRGDIGNTSEMYAKAFFEEMTFDAVTIAPYMGADSIKPFLHYKNKWAIVLALTSNPSSADFEMQKLENGRYLYEEVLHTTQQWSDEQNMMYVVGATQAQHLEHIRKIIPKHFILVPGVGAQGGDLLEVAQFGMNEKIGLLVNSSREILYASSGKDFGKQAALKAQHIQKQMLITLEK